MSQPLWHSIPYLCILLPLGSAAVTSVLKPRWARYWTMFALLVVTSLSGVISAIFASGAESYTYMMGHFPAPWGNEIRAGQLEAVTALFFSLIMLLSLLGGLKKIDEHIDQNKVSLYYVVLLLLTAALLLTSFVNPQNGIHINDIVIWLCNIGYVLVLQSCIGYRTYMRLYTKVMLAEAVISLISFVIGDLLSLPLPLLHYEVSSVNGFYLTPYFTLGWLNIPVFHRNAGMFNEPGSHQIFLNFALLFLMSDETRMGMSKKKYCWAIALLIVTILSTLSTTGFICLGVVLLTVAFRKKGGKMARSIKMAAFIGLILLFVIESVTGVVERKIVGRNSGGSFYTRWNDTFSGFEIGLESPIAGQGVFSERKAEILLEHRVQNISNGFAAFVMDTGLILPAVWLWLTYRGIRTKFAKARLLYVLGVFLLYFLCINTEGVFLNILFLGLLGKWQPDAEDTPDQQANARSQKKRRRRCTVPPEKLRLTFNTQPEDAAQEQTGKTGGEES